MAVQGGAALAGWFDYKGEPDMNEWQAREHIHERVSLPGFVRMRRFSSSDAHPTNFTFCETADLSALSSPAYLQSLNSPSEWSRRCAPGLYNMRRSLCRITATFGDVDGGTVATLELEPDDRTALRAWLTTDALPKAVEHPGVYAAHLLESDGDVSRIETTEKKLRQTPDTIVDWAVVLEGLDPGSVSAAAQQLLPAEALTSRGASAAGEPQVYRLAFAATH